MADITEPGATGRKVRGPGAPALAAGQDATPPAGADPALAAGTAPTASAQVGAVGGDAVIVAGGLGGAATALGLDPDARVIDVDPGVGASQRAVEAGGFQSVDPVAGAAPLNADERSELEDLRRRYAGLPTNREELATLRAAQIDASVAVAPAGERRFALAATQILRGGRTYLPHDAVPVDLEGYAELREIGAITITPWERLPLAGED